MESALAGAIVDPATHGTLMGNHRTDHDDATSPPMISHLFKGKLRANDSPQQVNVQDIPPVFDGHFEDVFRHRDSRIVDQYVDSTEVCVDKSEQVGHCRFVDDVSRHGEGTAVILHDALDNPLARQSV